MNNCQDCLRWEGKEGDLRARCSLLDLQTGRHGTCGKFTLRPPGFLCVLKPSRQTVYQAKLRRLGLCRGCRKPSGGHSFCDTCRVKINADQRKRMGHHAWAPGRPGRPPINREKTP